MLHSRKLNNKINKLQERALRIIYNDNISCFDHLLKKDRSVTIHHRNIQALAIEMFKVKNDLSPNIIQDIFQLRSYRPNIRNVNEFLLPIPNTVYYGTESPRHLGPKNWNMLPKPLKELSTLYSFKTNIKDWIPYDCPCKLCKTYVPDLGYIS